ncbi:condensation domain-containing protein [Streptosporangium saharense]|uniref:condensation domain-containing protein n=1 Tax=Streptosporangium saharense TaxID=1706840 RepID=UPI0036757FFA
MTTFPLSLQQAENMPPGFARATNVPVLAARFGAGLRPERLTRAFEAVVARHQALRLRMFLDDGEPRQDIAPVGGFTVEESFLPGAPDDAELTRLFEGVLAEPGDLAKEGPVTARLLRLGDGGHAALFAVRHVAADGWSVGVLNRDLRLLYLGERLPDLDADHYRHYVRHQRAQGDELTPRQREFFLSSLGDVPVLPARRPFGREPATSYHHAGRRLGADDTVALYGLARRLRTTPAKVVMAAAFLAVRAYFGRESFGVLDVSAGRERGQADWAGLLSRGVPLPVAAPGDMTAGRFVAEVHRHSMRALLMLTGPYSLRRVLALPYGNGGMAEALNRRFWTDGTPTAHSVMFNCLTVPPTPAAPFGTGVSFTPLWPLAPLAAEKSRISDLDVLPVLDGTSLTLTVAAHPGVHDEADAGFVLDRLERVLTGWARDWDQGRPLGRL